MLRELASSHALTVGGGPHAGVIPVVAMAAPPAPPTVDPLAASRPRSGDRPPLSVIVPDTITGRRIERSSSISSMAIKAAFAFSVSKMVSTNSRFSTFHQKKSVVVSHFQFSVERYGTKTKTGRHGAGFVGQIGV